MNAVRTENKNCCDQAAPELLDRLVEAKLQNLLTILSQQTGLSMENIGKTVSLLNGALAELKDLKDWKQSLKERDGNLFELNSRFSFKY